MTPNGHLHHVNLEQRDGGSFVTLECGTDFRESCEKDRFKKIAAAAIHPIRTDVPATREIVTAMNQGDSSYMRSNDAARDVRANLFTYLLAHRTTDPYCIVVEEDLRRHASNPLCGES